MQNYLLNVSRSKWYTARIPLVWTPYLTTQSHLGSASLHPYKCSKIKFLHSASNVKNGMSGKCIFKELCIQSKMIILKQYSGISFTLKTIYGMGVTQVLYQHWYCTDIHHSVHNRYASGSYSLLSPMSGSVRKHNTRQRVPPILPNFAELMHFIGYGITRCEVGVLLPKLFIC